MFDMHRDFLAKKYKTEYRTSTNRTASGEMCDMHLVIFLAKKCKTEYRTSTNRTESVEMCDMHLVIFLAKKYKTEYRTSTNRSEIVGERPRRPLTRPGTTPFNTA